jgi:hypothetical protein
MMIKHADDLTLGNGFMPMGFIPPSDASTKFARLGQDFAKAAKILYQHHQNQKSYVFWPTYFLVCQALELYLKAFLRANDVPAKYLKDKIGHDLQRACHEAKQKGLDKIVNLTKDEEQMIEILNPHYQNRDFQYKNDGEFTLVHLNGLISLLDRIDPPLFGFCVNANRKLYQ